MACEKKKVNKKKVLAGVGIAAGVAAAAGAGLKILKNKKAKKAKGE